MITDATNPTLDDLREKVNQAIYRRHTMLATEAADAEFGKLTYRDWEKRRQSELNIALDALVAAARAEGAAAASSNCPVCGRDTPHAHVPRDIEQWATDQVARWGYEAKLYWGSLTESKELQHCLEYVEEYSNRERKSLGYVPETLIALRKAIFIVANPTANAVAQARAEGAAAGRREGLREVADGECANPLCGYVPIILRLRAEAESAIQQQEDR